MLSIRRDKGLAHQDLWRPAPYLDHVQSRLAFSASAVLRSDGLRGVLQAILLKRYALLLRLRDIGRRHGPMRGFLFVLPGSATAQEIPAIPR